MRLVIERVSHAFSRDTAALRDVSLDVGTGMFGLLGPNGAGKSTLMRVVATLLRPNTGSVRFGDIDVLAHPESLRATLGYLPQEFGLHPTIPVDETLAHFAALKGLTHRGEREARVDALLAQTNLLTLQRRRVGTLSGGQRQRLGVAIALVGNPRLVILDEPTAGLDPAERYRLYDLLAGLASDRVVVLSTHLVDDVHELCDSMAILDCGGVVARGRPADLLEPLRGRLWRRTLDAHEVPGAATHGRVIAVGRSAGRRVARIIGDTQPDMLCTAADPTLEDVYFSFVGSRAFDDPNP